MASASTIVEYGPLLSYVALSLAGASAAVFLATLPGRRARSHWHPHASTIGLLGWLSLICPPLWIVAWCWAGWRRRRNYRSPGAQRMHVRVSPVRSSRYAAANSRPTASEDDEPRYITPVW